MLAALGGRLEEHSTLDSRSDVAGQIASDGSSGGREVIEEELVLGEAGLEDGVGELDAQSMKQDLRDLGRSAGGHDEPDREDVAQPGDIAAAGRFLVTALHIIVIIISRNTKITKDWLISCLTKISSNLLVKVYDLNFSQMSAPPILCIRTRESHDYVCWLNNFCLRATFGRYHVGSGYALAVPRDIL